MFVQRWRKIISKYFRVTVLGIFIITMSAPVALAGEGFEKYKRGLYAQIEKQKEAIRKNPGDAAAHFQLGLAYLALGKHQQEFSAYKEAIKLKPDFADAHYNLAVTYDLLNDGENALRHIMRSEQLYRMKRDHRNVRKSQRRWRRLLQKYDGKPGNPIPSR